MRSVEGAPRLAHVAASIHRRVVGQDEAVHGLLLALLTGGHVLLEGLPGLAKTLIVRSLADSVQASFRRVQFTPDLLPSDIVGSPVYHQSTGEFRVHRGPIFANIVLADEINRAPPKVQAALLEAMEERQVTIDGESYPLDDPFLVFATQNPLEQHGTYPLAEAQLDRFMLKLRISYPARGEEVEVVRMAIRADPATSAVSPEPAGAPATLEEIAHARAETAQVRVADQIIEYAVEVVSATRDPGAYGLSDLAPLIECGTSPRSSIFLVKAARAAAYLLGREYVIPDDIKRVALPILRHRLRTTWEADARRVDADAILRRILDTVPVP